MSQQWGPPLRLRSARIPLPDTVPGPRSTWSAGCPGFALDAGETSLRGFAGGAGNVVIDGKRPSTKISLTEVLSRIPAGAVLRIDLLSGSGNESGGQTLVADIITTGSGASGSWSAELERAPDGRVYPRAEVALSRPVGAWQTTTKVNGFWERFSFLSYRRERRDASGNLVQFQDESLPSALAEFYAGGDAKRDLAGGTLTLGARIGLSDYNQLTTRTGYAQRTIDPDLATDRRVVSLDSFYSEAELNAEWTRRLPDDWSLTVLSLGSIRDGNQESASLLEAPLATPAFETRFTSEQMPIEWLARSTFSKTGNARWKPEYGIEVAYNTLDSRLALSRQGEAILLPAANVTVDEIRTEIFSILVVQPAPRWTFEAGVAGEASRIRVSGDATSEQTTVIVKPSASLQYAVAKDLSARLALRRTAGQLNFEDFAASAEFEDDRQFGGNPELAPDKTWRLGATADWRAASGRALNVTLFHEWREDVLEQILLPSGIAGVGNAGPARVWGIESSFAWPLGSFIPGGRLEGTVNVAEAQFDDPVTGQARRLTGFERPDIDLAFRQDLASSRLSWGINFALATDTETYFVDEILRDRRSDQWSVFIETQRLFGLTTRLDISNIGTRDFPQERLFYSPNRSGALAGTERVDRTRGSFVTLTLSDTF